MIMGSPIASFFFFVVILCFFLFITFKIEYVLFIY